MSLSTAEERYRNKIPANLSGARAVEELRDLTLNLIRGQKRLTPDQQVVLHDVMGILKEMSKTRYNKAAKAAGRPRH